MEDEEELEPATPTVVAEHTTTRATLRHVEHDGEHTIELHPPAGPTPAGWSRSFVVTGDPGDAFAAGVAFLDTLG